MSQTILLIDSDPDTVEIVKYILTEAGYLVVLPISKNLLTDIKSIRPDLILIDDWSELISVSALVKAVKAINLFNSIPVLIFSTSINLMALAESCKADGFIKKPFEILELEETILAALSR